MPINIINNSEKMMSKNIITIGDKKFVTDAFLVGDMENIYLKKNEIDHMKKTSPEKTMTVYNDFLELLYPDIDSNYRNFVFLYNIIASEGKSNFKMGYKCSHCGKEVMSMFSIDTSNDFYTHKIDKNMSVIFGHMDGGEAVDVFEYVRSVVVNGTTIDWNLLSDSTQENIFSYIDMDDVVKIYENVQMCRATIKGHGVACCDKGVVIPKESKVFGGFNIFNILVNSQNLTSLYHLNHQLLSRGISLNDQLLMKPYERNIYITMIIKKEKEEMEKNEKSRISRG